MSTANQATTAAPAAQAPVKDKELRPHVPDTDFKEKYPPDRELGHELDDTARVWKVFRGEAIEHDDALLKTWNETVNILLTFAGLFSAAVTSFVVASTDDLKPDPNAYVANVLFALSNTSGGSASPFTRLPAPPSLEATPTSLARVVNGLWFTSLFLALAAALLCILVKQWLDEYTARTRGSAKHPRQWAQRRSFYHKGLIDWNVAAIISFLPCFLHLALFLFLAGLTVFLWDLDSAIRWVMMALMSLLLAFYGVSLLIPVWSAACPYATPLLVQLRSLGYTVLVGICIMRKWDMLCRTMIRRLLHRVFIRSNSASLPTSRHHTNTGAQLDSKIKRLLEQRSRRPFERILRRIMDAEINLPAPLRGDFAARLDTYSLEWLMHNVSDNDAVAVAWQSLGALLEEPDSFRFTRIVTVLPGLLEYAGGRSSLWRTLRMDGIFDDMQLGRIARSFLFLASSLGYEVGDILWYFLVPHSDRVYLENTLSPDAALIFAYALPEQWQDVVKVVRRIHGQGHRPLPSTATCLLNQRAPERNNSATEAAIGYLDYCDLRALSESAWTSLASLMCTSSSSDLSHRCGSYCVVNALCTRALQLIADETSGGSRLRQKSAVPFDTSFYVQIVVRIIATVSGPVAERANFSADVWAVLTDTRFLSRHVQREDRIRAGDWAAALSGLSESANRFYTSFATQFAATWSRLLRGCVGNHPTVILDEGIDFAGGADNAIWFFESASHVIPWNWQTEFMDLALRPARLRSALLLVESASIAICSMDQQPGFRNYLIGRIIYGLPLVSILPTDLALPEEEYNEWVTIFVSAVQHLMVLDLLHWNHLRDAVAGSPDQHVNDFFNEVHARLVEVGPCTKGDCAGQGPADWLAALGPRP